MTGKQSLESRYVCIYNMQHKLQKQIRRDQWLQCYTSLCQALQLFHADQKYNVDTCLCYQYLCHIFHKQVPLNVKQTWCSDGDQYRELMYLVQLSICIQSAATVLWTVSVCFFRAPLLPTVVALYHPCFAALT